MLALAAALFPLRMPGIGAGAAGLSAILTGVAIFLMASGIEELFDEQQTWDAGFYFAIVAAVLVAVAGILGLLAKRQAATASNF